MEGTPVRGAERPRNSAGFYSARDRNDLERELAKLIKEEIRDVEVIVTLNDASQPAFSNVVAIPIVFQGHHYGIVNIVSRHQNAALSHENIEAVRQIVHLSSPFIARLQDIEKLEQEKRDLQAIMQMRRHLESNLAHEFRTPMAAIRGYARMIVDGRSGEINDTQKDYLTVITENTNRLIQLVTWMAQVSERSAKHFKVSTFDLRELVPECIKSQEIVIREKAIKIDLQIPDATFVMIGDRDKLLRALSSLIASAVDSMSGQGRMRFELSHGREREIIAKISFSAVEAAVIDTSSFSVSELHDIIGMHGGRVFLKSKAGEGSTFLFTLPAVVNDGEGSFRNEQAVNSGRR